MPTPVPIDLRDDNLIWLAPAKLRSKHMKSEDPGPVDKPQDDDVRFFEVAHPPKRSATFLHAQIPELLFRCFQRLNRADILKTSSQPHSFGLGLFNIAIFHMAETANLLRIGS